MLVGLLREQLHAALRPPEVPRHRMQNTPNVGAELSETWPAGAVYPTHVCLVLGMQGRRRQDDLERDRRCLSTEAAV